MIGIPFTTVGSGLRRETDDRTGSVTIVRIRFGVLGPVTAEDADGAPVALKGPMHRAVLARLLVARGRVVTVPDLVDDLWISPPKKAISAVRTFVAALRRAVEPDRPARHPAALLVTRGSGYALLATPDQVDAWRFERAVRPDATLAELEEALGWWRGPAYADFPDAAWPRADRARLTELRLRAVELRAEALLTAGRPADAVPDLDEHVTEHPWREPGWRLLALALYRSGRQGDALAVLRRARELLAGQLGIDPGPELRTLETDILRQSPILNPPPFPGGSPTPPPPPLSPPAPPTPTHTHHKPHPNPSPRPPRAQTSEHHQPLPPADSAPDHHRPLPPRVTVPKHSQPSPPPDSVGEHHQPLPPPGSAGGHDQPLPPPGSVGEHHQPLPSSDSVFTQAAAAYERLVPDGSRARLESAVGLLRNLATTGPDGLQIARAQRAAAVQAAEQLGDPELTARVIGAYDVPALWTRSDDPAQSATITAAAERALVLLPTQNPKPPTTKNLPPAKPSQPGGNLPPTSRLGSGENLPPVARPDPGGNLPPTAEHQHAGNLLPVGNLLPAGGHDAARARLLATIAIESRGTRDPRPLWCANEAEAIARDLDDPALLTFALNGTFMQSCHHTGNSPQRDAIGAELVAIAARHGLVTMEVLGHLIRLQAACATASFTTADRHAEAADRLAARHEIPLVTVFTEWYRALRTDLTNSPKPKTPEPLPPPPATEPGSSRPPVSAKTLASTSMSAAAHSPTPTPASAAPMAASAPSPAPTTPAAAETATTPKAEERTETETANPYQAAGLLLDRAGMPGLQVGLLPLATLGWRLRRGLPLVDEGGWGPYEIWARLLIAPGETALADVPDPPADLLAEALWCLFARAAVISGDRTAMARAREALAPAAAEWAGAASGLLTVGRVSDFLHDLTA